MTGSTRSARPDAGIVGALLLSHAGPDRARRVLLLARHRHRRASLRRRAGRPAGGARGRGRAPSAARSSTSGRRCSRRSASMTPSSAWARRTSTSACERPTPASRPSARDVRERCTSRRCSAVALRPGSMPGTRRATRAFGPSGRRRSSASASRTSRRRASSPADTGRLRRPVRRPARGRAASITASCCRRRRSAATGARPSRHGSRAGFVSAGRASRRWRTTTRSCSRCRRTPDWLDAIQRLQRRGDARVLRGRLAPARARRRRADAARHRDADARLRRGAVRDRVPRRALRGVQRERARVRERARPARLRARQAGARHRDDRLCEHDDDRRGHRRTR